MFVPFVLLIGSLIALACAVIAPGASDFSLLAGSCAVASLILLLRAGFSDAGTAQAPAQRRLNPRGSGPIRRRRQQWVVVDGSNVMHWKNGEPQIETLREVLRHLISLGFSPGVVFDANAGHLLAGKYQHHHAMGKHLGLSEDRVMVVDKGTPADSIILAAARDLGARVISNDRYKDWADQHPEVHIAGHIVRGGYRDGKLWLDLDKDAAGQRFAAKP